MLQKLPTIEEQDEPSNKSSGQSRSEKVPQNKIAGSQHSQIGDRSSKTSQKEEFSRVISPQKQQKPLPEVKPSIINHFKDRNVTLVEDYFGLYYDDDGKPFKIQRFTWKNCNKMQVQVITYGARVVSIKVPDKKGIIDDVVLGFSDLAGYIHYGKEYFGATVGIITDKIKDGAFLLDGREYKVSCNLNGDHANGGDFGLDKAIWKAYVNGSKVTLNYTVPDRYDGFPGPIVIKITYELTFNNEFSVDMEARTVKPTIINLSNLCFFNLGGHHSGPESTYNHSVVINANCYTIMDEENYPTGKIMNIVNTKYDFLKPKLLRHYLNVEPNDGYDQNLCINRATAQQNCFVARAVHVLNGRVLEVYSNQYGVNFETANNWGLGVPALSIARQLSISSTSLSSDVDGDHIFQLLNMVHEKMDQITVYTEKNFKQILNLLKRIKNAGVYTQPPQEQVHQMSFLNPDFDVLGFVNLLEKSVTELRKAIPSHLDDITNWTELKIVVDTLLQKYHDMDAEEVSFGTDMSNIFGEGVTDYVTEIESNLATGISNTILREAVDNATSKSSLKKLLQSVDMIQEKSQQSVVNKSKPKSQQSIKEKSQISVKIKDQDGPTKNSSAYKTSSKYISDDPSYAISNESQLEVVDFEPIKPTNIIPNWYKDGRIHGKNNAIYKRHGAIAFQTQNYPDAIHHSNFPSPILRPGKTYRHSIVYKFWVKTNGLNGLKTRQRCMTR